MSSKLAIPTKLSPSLQSTARPEKRVDVVRCGQYCAIEPPCPELNREFYTLRNQPEDDEQHGYRIVRRPYPLVFPMEDRAGTPISACLAGLRPLVVNRLRQLGYLVGEETEPWHPLPAPRSLPLGLAEAVGVEALANDEAFLTLLEHHDRGLVEYDVKHVKPALLIAQAAITWPTARIVVAVTRAKDAWKLRHQLARLINPADISVYTMRACPSRGTRIAIGTYTQMGGGEVSLHRRQIFFSLNPTEMLTSFDGKETIKAAQMARMYGFVGKEQRVRPYERDLLLSLFGTRRVGIPGHGMVDRPVDVAILPMYGGPRMPSDGDLVTIKRQGVWEHPLRNRRIAALALALAAGDLDEVEHRFPEVPSLLPFRGARIAVLVENVDHGLSLAKRLGGCPVLATRTLARDGLTSQERSILHQGRLKANKLSKLLIVTPDRLQDAGRRDIIIRADGGVSVPDADLAMPLHFNYRGPRRVLVIDFDDRHHPILRQRYKQRKTSCLTAGWNILHDPRTELDRFMANRPKVVWT